MRPHHLTMAMSKSAAHQMGLSGPIIPTIRGSIHGKTSEKSNIWVAHFMQADIMDVHDAQRTEVKTGARHRAEIAINFGASQKQTVSITL